MNEELNFFYLRKSPKQKDANQMKEGRFVGEFPSIPHKLTNILGLDSSSSFTMSLCPTDAGRNTVGSVCGMPNVHDEGGAGSNGDGG